MSLLRKITKPKWFDQPWMSVGDVPADALVDLRTQSNELSVWRVEPGEENLHAVIAALASNKTDRLSNVDYVLLDEAVLTGLGIRLNKTDGNSPHLYANSRWHCDLVELTAAKLVGLAREVKRRETEHKRVQHSAVREILRAALRAGALERAAVAPTLLEALEP